MSIAVFLVCNSSANAFALLLWNSRRAGPLRPKRRAAACAVRLCALFKVITDGDHQPPPKADEGVAFLTIGNITTGRLDFAGCRLVPTAYFKSLAPYRRPAKGDILYTVVGATYGLPAVVQTIAISASSAI